MNKMKLNILLVFICACLLAQVAPDKSREKRMSMNKGLSAYLMPKREASSFEKKGYCDSPIIGGLDYYCCKHTCWWEKRAEYAEDCGWKRTDEVLCYLSIRSGKKCNCKSRSGNNYECSSHLRTESCICKDKFWCRKDRKCIPHSKKCNSYNDCGNFNDERGCKIAANLPITLKGGQPGVSGNVFIGGRPVCRRSWNNNAAKVVCRKLKLSGHTFAIARHSGYFGNTARNFIINDVRCNGRESDLRHCSHNTMIDSYCSSQSGSGVECMDPLKTKLKGGVQKNEGFVYLSGYVACSDKWNRAASQVICNQFYKSQFPEYNYVPVFSETGSNFGSSDRFVIQQVNCKGNEKFLTQCRNFRTAKRQSCSKKVKVQCAKCTTSSIVSILKKVKWTNDPDQTKYSVELALKELSSTCYDWNCKESYKTHPNYCKTKAALEDLKLILENSKKEILLTNKFNVIEELKHNFMKSQFGALQNSLNGLQSHITNFQSQLSQYFVQRSQYQEARLVGEISDLKILLEDTTAEKKEQEAKFESLVKILIQHSTNSVAAEFVHRMIRLAFRIVQTYMQADPTVLFDVDDELAAVAKAGNNFVKIHFLVSLLPKFSQTAKRIVNNMKVNKEAYIALAELLDKNQKPMTYERAKNYVTLSISSPYSTADLSDIQTYLEDIVDGLCDVLFDGETLTSQLAQAGATKSGICHKTKLQAARVVAYHEQLDNTYQSMGNYLKDIAKSKLEVHLAQQMASTLSKPLGNQVDMEITKLQSMISLRLEKRYLIDAACQRMTYMNHNEELPVCTNLKKNMDGNLGPLMSFDFDREMCSESTNVEKYINFPIDTNDPDFEITDIFPEANQESQMYFKIRDNQWLADHGWIDQYSTKFGPFYLKSINVIPPPIFSLYGLSISTAFVLVENKIGDAIWNFHDRLLARTDVLMNGVCSKYTRPSPYDLPGCPSNAKVCLTSEGKFNGPMYPSLLARFSIKIRHNKPVNLNIPKLTTPLILKAKVEFCFKHKEKREIKLINVEERGACCANNGNSYYNILNELKGKPPCQKCPKNSKPGLHGYFCQSH